MRLIASDLDGTLLNERSVISQETAEMMRKSQQEGIQWIVATGRSFKTASALIKQAGVYCDYLLLNGAEFRKKDGTLIFQESMKDSCARKIIHQLFARNIDFEINTSLGDFSTDCEFCDTASPIPSEEKLFQEKIKIQKIFIFSEDQEKREEIREFLKKIEEIFVKSSADWNIEVTDRQADKGKMLERVADYYGFSKDEILVFGDGENDVPMFEKFPHSRAMGNASPGLKEIAEKVVGTNVENGVAEEVRKILNK